jgi:hypothetical protein
VSPRLLSYLAFVEHRDACDACEDSTSEWGGKPVFLPCPEGHRLREEWHRLVRAEAGAPELPPHDPDQVPEGEIHAR